MYIHTYVYIYFYICIYLNIYKHIHIFTYIIFHSTHPKSKYITLCVDGGRPPVGRCRGKMAHKTVKARFWPGLSSP